jgi:hypothetical protein
MNANGFRHQEAFDHAHRKMLEERGPQPPAPPSTIGLGFRILWLLKVKRMDWRKLGLGAVGAFLVGAAAAAGPLMGDGITGPELVAAAAAGMGALGLYLKDPNAHKGQDPRQKPGVTKILSK